MATTHVCRSMHCIRLPWPGQARVPSRLRCRVYLSA